MYFLIINSYTVCYSLIYTLYFVDSMDISKTIMNNVTIIDFLLQETSTHGT